MAKVRQTRGGAALMPVPRVIRSEEDMVGGGEFDVDPAMETVIGQDVVPVEESDEIELPEDAVTEAVEEAAAAEETERKLKPVSWEDNLIGDGPDQISQSDADALAQELLMLFDEDKRSRAPWDEKFETGLSLLGMTKNDGPKLFANASTVTHPVLAEAMVQFNARAMAELFPASGPVKGKVLGEATDQIEAQRERVETHMNYQYVEEMEEAYSELDKLTFRIAYEGSSFKKVFYDPLLGRMRSIYVSGRHVVVPYTAQGLQQSPRISHYYGVHHNDLLKYQEIGFWLKREIQEPSTTKEEDGPDTKVAETEGREQTDTSDGDHTIVEMQVYYDFDKALSLRHIGLDGQPSGIGRPFLVTILKEEGIALSIRRDWAEGDDKERRDQKFAHYGFIPGFGFYYFGFLHLIGGLAKATTDSVRALLDSAAFANAQGGFKSKDMRAARGDVTIEAGKWKDIDVTSDELAKGFYTPPYKEPSPALFQLLGALTDYARRFSSTTEAMVGEGSNATPVGTQLARIEQGTKVFSGIHKRLHNAQAAEFRILARLNFKHLPENPASISWNGSTIEIFKSDYDGRVDVIPVSDPNLYSQAQKLAIAQGVLQLAATSQNIDKAFAERMMLEAMQVPKYQIEKLMPDQSGGIVPLDPVSENQLMTVGKPVKAFPDQFHTGHIATHKAYIAMLSQSGMPPELLQRVILAMWAHIAEHLAFDFRTQIVGQMMQQAPQLVPALPAVDINAQPGQPPAPPVDPQIDQLIAGMVGQWMQEATAQQQGGEGQPDPEVLKAQADIKRKDEAHAAEQKRKDAAAARDMARKDAGFQQDQELKDAAQAAETIRGTLHGDNRP